MCHLLTNSRRKHAKVRHTTQGTEIAGIVTGPSLVGLRHATSFRELEWRWGVCRPTSAGSARALPVGRLLLRVVDGQLPARQISEVLQRAEAGALGVGQPQQLVQLVVAQRRLSQCAEKRPCACGHTVQPQSAPVDHVGAAWGPVPEARGEDTLAIPPSPFPSPSSLLHTRAHVFASTRCGRACPPRRA